MYELSHLLNQSMVNQVHTVLQYKLLELERLEVFMDMVQGGAIELWWGDIVQKPV